MNQPLVTKATGLDRKTPAHLLIPQLLLHSMFWRPKFLAASDWLEHIPVAFWLVEAHQPQRIVELGTQDGVSYFAFCQAIERLQPLAECLAFSAAPLADSLHDYNEAQYQEFSRLESGSQAHALAQLDEASIDLLHVTASVALPISRQWERWEEKLSPNGLVVISGLNSQDQASAMALFERLRQKYPCFTFHQGEGLGIVGVGPQQSDTLSRLFSFKGTDQAHRLIQQVFKRLGVACAATQRLALAEQRQSQRLNELAYKDKKISGLQATITALQARLNANEEMVSTDTSTTTALEQQLADMQSRLESTETARTELEASLQTLKQVSQTQKQALDEEKQRTSQQLSPLKQRIEVLNQEKAHSQQRLNALEQSLKEYQQHNELLRHENSQLIIERDTRFSELAGLTQLLEEKDDQLEVLKEKITPATSQDAGVGRVPFVYLGKQLSQKRREARKLKSQIQLVRDSGLFDEAWYLESYPDVRESGIPPIDHFVRFGGQEGRSPGPGFDTAWYLNSYPDVTESEINPLIHYIKFGKQEQRSPTPQTGQGKGHEY